MNRINEKLKCQQQTSLNSDTDAKLFDVISSMGSGDYMLEDFHKLYSDSFVEDATQCPDVNFDDGYGVSQRFIDDEKRIGKLSTCKAGKCSLMTRPFNMPYLGKGPHNVDDESILLSSDDTVQRLGKKYNREAYIQNQFVPLVPNLQNNVQNPDNIIPEDSKVDWVRGGIDTTQIPKDVDYLQRCRPDEKRIKDVLVNASVKSYLLKNNNTEPYSLMNMNCKVAGYKDC